MRTVPPLPARHRRSGRGRVPFFLLFVLGLTALLAGPLAGGASGEVSGGCTATLKGQDVGPRSSTKPADAIDVDAKDEIVATATSSAPITGYKVQLEAGGFKWTVARGTASGNSWQRSVSVDKYASHGVGLYKVLGISTGPGACTGAVLVNVKGKGPLTTTAGLVGAALTGLGGIGIVTSAVRAVRRGVPASARGGALALLILPPMMIVGMGGSGSVPSSTPADHQRGRAWRLRLSPLAVLSGGVGGLGVVVLLQQYAVAYPTRGLALTGIGGGVLLGLLATNLLPLLFRGPAERSAPVAAAPEEPLAAAEEVNVVDGETTPAWAPTHTVPATGLPAWAEPDDAADIPVDKLDAGLEVVVFERSGTWAHIRCSNGWSAWVDGPQLVEMTR